MKTLKWTALFITLVLVAVGASTPASASVDVSFGLFYSNLSPHGSWLVSAGHGRVWRPHVYAAGWNPYYDGSWMYTDLGWSWVSDYSWGGIPYHYGTWAYDAALGWVWVPGYVWAPAWVVFRTGPDYIGWAPVPPAYSIGVAVRLSNYQPHHYVFVPTRDFLARRVRARALPPARVRTLINRTTIVNNIRVENNVVVNRGPDVRIIEKARGSRIKPSSIERVPKAGPTRSVTRESLRVDQSRSKARVRAAEPMSERESRRFITERDRSPRQPADAGRGTVRGRDRSKPDNGNAGEGARDRRTTGPAKQDGDRPQSGSRSKPRKEKAKEAKPRDKPER